MDGPSVGAMVEMMLGAQKGRDELRLVRTPLHVFLPIAFLSAVRHSKSLTSCASFSSVWRGGRIDFDRFGQQGTSGAMDNRVEPPLRATRAA